MKYVAGVDIGNATTEVALAKIDGTDLTFLASGIGPTTGIKGTLQNISGVFMSLKNALEKVGMDYSDLAEIRINEAAPVIGDVAMETISETVITESTVIGHNPSTPGGTGIGVGTSVLVTELSKIKEAKDVIVIVPDKVGFAQAAALMNQAKENIHITGAIVQADDGVLLNNRLDKKIPIIDEVAMIEKVPLGMTCAIEVAQQGSILSTLSNPYGIATVFHLNSEETKRVVPIARSLIGARSGVVIKTPTGDVKERSIKAGTINIIGLKKEVDVDVDEGADKIMEAISVIQDIDGNNIGDDLPSEYSGSKYTHSIKGTNAKAKANAVQGISEMIEIAVGKHFRENKESKHWRNAMYGWYRYDSRFAIPVYRDDEEVERYNIFHASLIVRYSEDGKLYLYDVIDIKKRNEQPD